MPEDKRLTRFFEVFNLERGLIAGSGILVLGLALLVAAINQWRLAGFE